MIPYCSIVNNMVKVIRDKGKNPRYNTSEFLNKMFKKCMD